MVPIAVIPTKFAKMGHVPIPAKKALCAVWVKSFKPVKLEIGTAAKIVATSLSSVMLDVVSTIVSMEPGVVMAKS